MSSSVPSQISPESEQAGEAPVGIELDHELHPALVGRQVGHRERAVVAVVARDRDVDVLAGVELDLGRLQQLELEPPDVVGELLDRGDARLRLHQREARLEHVLVVVDQLDLEVGQGVGAAQQRPALLLLEVGQRERRVAVEVDLAVEQERLAGGALPLLAAVHQLQALPEGGVEDGLVLVDLEVDPDRLEPDVVLFTHLALASGSAMGAARATPPPAGPRGRRACTWRRTSRGPRGTSR